MKKLLIPLAALTVVLTTAICVKSNAKLNGILAANVEALAGEPEEDKNGVLYANPSGTNFCCGEGNVRDCAKLGIDMCPDYL